MEQLEHWDKLLFTTINSLHNSFFDWVMYWLSDKLVWIPLYLFLLFVFYRIYKRKTIVILLAAFLTIVATDQFSVIIKNSFKRYRPCHNTELQTTVRTPNGCGGQYGFVSSHAANVFGLATLTFLLLRNNKRKFSYVIFIWAILVSYSRIYNGVHYPSDVIGGAILGGLCAFVFYYMFVYLTSKIKWLNE